MANSKKNPVRVAFESWLSTDSKVAEAQKILAAAEAEQSSAAAAFHAALGTTKREFNANGVNYVIKVSQKRGTRIVNPQTKKSEDIFADSAE